MTPPPTTEVPLLLAWDRSVLLFLAEHRTPALTEGAHALALLGGLGVLPWVTLALALWLTWRRAPAHGLLLLAGVYGAIALNVLLKVAFARPRPDALGALVEEPGFSFPSGHAMSNAAFALALALVFWHTRARRPVALAALLWALAVALSRPYLGAHYPSDVLVGVVLSVGWVLALAAGLRRVFPALGGPPGK